MAKEMTFALREEIGDPHLFVGRRKELAELLTWCEGAKRQTSKSRALLSRRKKGKTALVQRLYNILFANGDPNIIPFYFRVGEQPISTPGFAQQFYQSFMGQYLGFQKRIPP